MRYCNHRDQCPWRCFTARQDNKHTLVGLSRPPRKANVAPGNCRSTEQFSQTISAVKPGVQVESMLVRKRLRHRYPALTMVCAKTGQLSTVVSSLTAKQWPRNSSSLHTKPQKLAACTSLPLTEEEPEKSASLCFQCNHLQRPAQHLHCLCTKICQSGTPNSF